MVKVFELLAYDSFLYQPCLNSHETRQTCEAERVHLYGLGTEQKSHRFWAYTLNVCIGETNHEVLNFHSFIIKSG